MECIKVITDKDFGLDEIELKNPKLRYASRGIVLRDDGKIAVFNKANMNEYKLPGGGLDPNEKPEDGFLRECLEETGCEVEIIEKLGYTEERKGKTNFKQISHIFVGRVKRDLGHLNVTEKEKIEGAKLIWATPQEALKLIENCVNELKSSPCDVEESLYSTSFVVIRDKYILKYYLNKISDKATNA